MAAATTQTWSTALRFAPRKSNSSGNKPKARPPPGFAAASVTNVSAGSVAASSLPRNPGKAPASSVSSVHTASTVSPAAGPSKVSRSQSSPSVPVPSTTQRSRAFEPPALTLPPEEIEADRALARLAAEERGERRPQDEDEHEDGVELDDVNGFYGTDRGRKTKKKVRRVARDVGTCGLTSSVVCVRKSASGEPLQER
jgi:splicing factor 45